MKTTMLFLFSVIAIAVSAQTTPRTDSAEEAIRGWLENVAVMEADNEGDPNQKKLITLVDIYRTMERVCEDSGIDKRRILDLSKERVDGYIAASSEERSFGVNAARLLNLMTVSGDRSLLPYLEEKSLSPGTYKSIRSSAASAYVKIADLDEAAGFLMKYCADPSVQQGKWLVAQQFLDKYGAQDSGGIPPEVAARVNTVLMAILQTTDVRDVANRINQHLLRHVPQYTNSAQRASLARFATVGNAWVTNTFHPVKAHFDKIPPSKRIDLRKRFPDLPPLPEDKTTGRPLKVTLFAVAALAALVAVYAAVWLTAKRRKTRNHADG